MSKPLSERLEELVQGCHGPRSSVIREAAALARRVEGAAKVTVVNDVIGPHIDLATWHAADSWPGTYALVPTEG